MKRVAICFVLCAVLFALTACRTDQEAGEKGKTETGQTEEETAKETEAAAREYHDVAYDTLSDAQTFDLYLPRKGDGPFPLVLFIHGGGWYRGDKADGQERAWLSLREQGYGVASVNYRLSGEAPHPAGIIDCKTALRYIKAHADKYAVDPDRIAVAGDSSGGHYALLLALTAGNADFEDASRGNAGQDTEVDCAVIWYPVTDLAEIMRSVKRGEYKGFEAGFLWDSVERCTGKKIDAISKKALLEASPIHYVTGDMPPVLLQHGDADAVCPASQSRRIYRKMVREGAGDKVRLDIMEGAGHRDAAFETPENMARIRGFLESSMQ